MCLFCLALSKWVSAGDRFLFLSTFCSFLLHFTLLLSTPTVAQTFSSSTSCNPGMFKNLLLFVLHSILFFISHKYKYTLSTNTQAQPFLFKLLHFFSFLFFLSSTFLVDLNLCLVDDTVFNNAQQLVILSSLFVPLYAHLTSVFTILLEPTNNNVPNDYDTQ